MKFEILTVYVNTQSEILSMTYKLVILKHTLSLNNGILNEFDCILLHSHPQSRFIQIFGKRRYNKKETHGPPNKDSFR